MHRILVIDDDEAIRKNLDRLLSLEGYEVATASDGQHGLAVALSMRPAIIVTDINMPQMDGFALLDAVRAHPELERTAVIMLTAAEDRSHVRKGMASGADDYITKPFKREELLEAIAAQLAKISRFERHTEQAVSQAQLQLQTAANLSLAASPTTWADPALGSAPAHGVQATVLFASMRQFAALANHLSEDELSQLLSHYFSQICQPVVAYGGTHLKISGDGLLALFEEGRYAAAPDDSRVHACRALSAAMALHAAAQDIRVMLTRNYSARGLPEWHVAIGLHSGEVILNQSGSCGVTPMGQAVDTAHHMLEAGKLLGWAIAASTTTTQLAGDGVQLGREQALGNPGAAALPSACEVLGYHTSLNLQHGLDKEAMAFEKAVIELTVQENAQTTARAAKTVRVATTA
jgi:serine/threonine-protein kinase PpkA